MVRLLFTSDFHLNESLVSFVEEQISKHDVDVVINTGDFLSNEFANSLADVIDSAGIKGFFIEGNWDNELNIFSKAVKVLRFEVVSYKDLYFFGANEKIYFDELFLQDLVENVPSNKLVFLTHEPPLGILDKIWSGSHVGNEYYLRFDKLKSPLIHAFGHIHEANGYIKRGKTLYINAAMPEIHNAYLVDVEEKIKIKTLTYKGNDVYTKY